MKPHFPKRGDVRLDDVMQDLRNHMMLITDHRQCGPQMVCKRLATVKNDAGSR